MRKKTYWQIEALDQFSWRVQVIGGWIVYCESYTNTGSVALTSTFVADKDHEWQVLEKELPVIKTKPAEAGWCL